jgi:copper chaperone
MKNTILRVDGMTCEHCVTAVTKALKDLSDVSAVTVHLPTKSVMVEYNPELAFERIKEAIESAGYTVIE